MVLEALALVRSRQELSQDNPVGDDAEVCVGDLIPAPDSGKNQKTSWPNPG